MARINLDKYRSLRRLYGGLRVLTILAGGLLAMLALSMLFYHPAAALGPTSILRSRDPAGAPALPGLGTPATVTAAGVREASGIAWHASRGRCRRRPDAAELSPRAPWSRGTVKATWRT
jgi:hypothetical protein